MTVLRRSREISFVRQIVLQRRVSKLLLPTADKIKQTGATCLEKLVPSNQSKYNLTNLCDDS